MAMGCSPDSILRPAEPFETEALMEKEFLLEIEDFSEWRLFTGFTGFDIAGVNKGFQIRDFQTSQGTSIIVDPEPYRKLQVEASTIWKALTGIQVVLLLVLYLVALVFEVCLLVMEQNGVAILIGWFVSMVLGLAVFCFVTLFLQKQADSRITAVVDSYKQQFLTAYGVELGYGKVNMSALPKVLFRAIHLRRPRRAGEEDVLTASDFEVPDGGQLPPIFIDRTFPGDIHVNEQAHDASMKVDAETWALLQSVHQKLVQKPPFMGFFLLIYVVSYLYFDDLFRATIAYVCVTATFLVTRSSVIYGTPDYRSVRVYEEVTRRVNEALQRDENRSQLAIEFHTSDLPGRDTRSCQRYQFVNRDLTPSKTIV